MLSCILLGISKGGIVAVDVERVKCGRILQRLSANVIGRVGLGLGLGSNLRL